MFDPQYCACTNKAHVALAAATGLLAQVVVKMPVTKNNKELVVVTAATTTQP